MKKQNLILSTALAAIFSTSAVFAEAEVTGKIVHESASFIESGIGIGAAATSIQTTDTHGKDVFKVETTAKIYIDGDIDKVSEGATYHVELNLMKDSKALNDYDSNESYTQRDALREAYIDMEKDDWLIRAGKQQVVWGTADGMKLLDMINPTDYSEMAQNQMEDSRIPVWMVNAETDLEAGGSFQIIASQAKDNVIAGLNSNTDQGHAFIMKGVDTITGKTNGFLYAAPAMGKVSKFFVDAAGGNGGANLAGFTGANVNDFAGETSSTAVAAFAGLCTSNVTDAVCLAEVSNDTGNAPVSYASAAKGANGYVTNLILNDNSKWDTSNADTVFELMNQATFATFADFQNMTTTYKVETPSNDNNLGLRFKDSTKSGLNYSLNYVYGYDANPYIDLHWEDSSGNTYIPTYSKNSSIVAGTASTHTCGTSDGMLNNGTFYDGIGSGNVFTCTSTNDLIQTTVELVKSGTDMHTAGETANLVFTQKKNRVNNYGASFDTAVETDIAPVVLRGEFLYQKDVKTPIVSKAALAIGDLTGGLKSESADYFKYVLGADITVMTNLMVSGQFIQMRNLDFIDETHTPVDAAGTSSSVSGVRYTADSAVMHLTNSLQKAEENKEFYSLFFSKPFGASGEHRWNNIFMFEENGGKWNRLDAEFSIDDDTQATVEYNKYWGDANTQFGQLEKSSNVQVGFKYSF